MFLLNLPPNRMPNRIFVLIKHMFIMQTKLLSNVKTKLLVSVSTSLLVLIKLLVIGLGY